jgi:hypothetical protein
MIDGHTCIGDDGGTAGRKCQKCQEEVVQHKQPEPPILININHSNAPEKAWLIITALNGSKWRIELTREPTDQEKYGW